MDIKQLRYFLKVVETKSITKAAEFCHVAQPAIGIQIRNLEDELGVKLLVRHARGVLPTEAGEQLAERADSFLREMERTRHDIMEIGSVPRGRVAVGMTATVATLLAAPLVRACRAKFPDVSLSIDEAMSQRVTEWITEGRLDLALTFSPIRSPDIEVQELAEDRMRIIVPAGHPLAGAAEIAMRDLLPYDVILTTLKPAFFRSALEKIAEDSGVTLRLVCETASIATAIKLVCYGLGCTPMPLGAVQAEIKAGEIVALPVSEPQIRRFLYLGFSRKRLGSKAVNVVRDEIRRLVGELVETRDVGWERVADRSGPEADPR